MKQEDDWRVQREMISSKLWKDYRGVQKHSTDAPHCTMCTCGTKRSAGLNKLGHILKRLFYYPIQHIFVPCCSVRRNMGKFQFS